jgi:hypothetical protein
MADFDKKKILMSFRLDERCKSIVDYRSCHSNYGSKSEFIRSAVIFMDSCLRKMEKEDDIGSFEVLRRRLVDFFNED